MGHLPASARATATSTPPARTDLSERKHEVGKVPISGDFSVQSSRPLYPAPRKLTFAVSHVRFGCQEQTSVHKTLAITRVTARGP
jgi:hypothetical protein